MECSDGSNVIISSCDREKKGSQKRDVRLEEVRQEHVGQGGGVGLCQQDRSHGF